MSSINESTSLERLDITQDEQKKTFKKIAFRLLPFLFLAYAINAIDRINISFAKLRMSEDLLLSDAAYGIGAAAFFVGYLLFEIPSNLYMQKVGTRATLTRIMVLWGIVTMLMSTVESAMGFYVLRFLLGVAEAGFFPGVILYLTYWFPGSLRGRITSVFFMAGIMAGIVSGPLAGWIMSNFHGWFGLKDWQALFVLEGIPAVILGFFAWFWLVDHPEKAKWLTAREKLVVQYSLSSENQTIEKKSIPLKQLLCDPRILIAGFVFFCIYSGTNTVAYWMPTLIKEFGIHDIRQIGLISSLPYITALVAMYILGRSSDKRLERRWHLALTMLVGAISFTLLGLFQNEIVLSISLLTLGAAACLAAVPLFWTIPPAYLSSTAAAAGIALISTLGGMAAVLSPILVGTIKTQTGSIYMAFSVIALLLVIGAVTLLLGIPARLLRDTKS